MPLALNSELQEKNIKAVKHGIATDLPITANASKFSDKVEAR